jgi:large subunit ribosomal protein L18
MIRDSRKRRHLHIRNRVAGTQGRPRLCVKRSNANIFAQLVDDSSGKVLTGVSSLSPSVREKKLKRMEASKEVGRQIAAKAKELGLAAVVFDRAGYRYHGRVKAVAEGAREGGLKF